MEHFLKKLTDVLLSLYKWSRASGFLTQLLSVFIGASLGVPAGLFLIDIQRKMEEKLIIQQIFCELEMNKDIVNAIATREVRHGKLDSAFGETIIPRRPRLEYWDIAKKGGALKAVIEPELIFKIARAYSFLKEVDALLVYYHDFQFSSVAGDINSSKHIRDLLDALISTCREARGNTEVAIKAIQEKAKQKGTSISCPPSD